MFDKMILEPQIKDIEIKVLEPVERDWRIKWLNAQNGDITREAEKLARANIEEEKKDAGEYWERSLDNNEIKEKIKQIEGNFDVYLNIHKRTIQKDYTEKFNKEVWPAYQREFIAEIEAHIKPQIILNLFLDKHPWLGKINLLNFKRSIIYSFLIDFITRKFLELLSVDSLNDLPLNNPRDLKWKKTPLDMSSIEKEIEGYPVSEVEQFYIENSRFEHTNLYSSSEADFKSLAHFNYSPTRIDIFRYLHSHSPSSMEAREIKGIKCTAYAPFLFSELKNLKPEQLEHLKILLVNVGEEDEPIWVMLHKQQEKNWVAYVPPHEEGKVYSQWPDAFGNVKVESITYDKNVASGLNDINLPPKAQWHAVLLGRIFPWCHLSEENNYDTPLAEYLKNVPASLLYQYAMERCIHVDGYYITDRTQLLSTAFRERKPFTDLPLSDIFQGKKITDQKGYLLKNKNLINRLDTEKTLEAFTKGELSIADDFKSITVNHQDRLLDALDIVYHSSSISQLKVERIPKITDAMKEIFDYDINLRTILPGDSFTVNKEEFARPLHCAARNRFLAEVNPKVLNDAPQSITHRKELWNSVGREMVAFFKKHTTDFDLDFINKFNKADTKWRKTYCDNDNRMDLSEAAWTLAQIPQMGSDALHAMFKYIEDTYSKKTFDDPDPAPNLACTFDLRGSLTDKPSTYMVCLLDNIVNCKKSCTPLFSSLSLIVPPLDGDSRPMLVELIRCLNDRKKRYPQELNEINLYNLPIASIRENEDLLNDILNEINDLQIQINIPQWNRDSPHKPGEQKNKALYLNLQNQILNNQRQANQERKFPNNIKNIYDCTKDEFKPEVIINRLAKEQQLWEGKNDETYPLTSQSPGIQQQLQQEVRQEFKAEQVQEQEHKHEHKQDVEQREQIVEYPGNNESDLITRENIDSFDKYREIWAKVDHKIKERSGCQEEGKLSTWFSLWVGSEKNAPNVIEKIQPAALQKIMENAAQFLLGISNENLPPGFYLAQSRANKGLILCFDERKEKQVLKARAETPIAKRNPFTVEFHQPREATEFRGDYRQFKKVLKVNNKEPTEGQQQMLWQYLATEDKDEERINNATKKLAKWAAKDNPINEAYTSVASQYLDVNTEIFRTEDYVNLNYEACLQYLRNWAAVDKPLEGLLEALFVDLDTRLNEKNLKAFGQLFNYFDIIPENVDKYGNGTKHWLFLANQIFSTFGPEHFKIWKKRFLDVSENWSELLEKEEVEAISLSIATLKNSQNYQDIWWRLVEAHGEATGHMRYADLWYAFQKVLNHIESKHLHFNEESLKEYLKKPNFNATVFLDRLYHVLSRTSNQLDSQLAQQQILDNIHEIDWRHNGLYYASYYENYPYWHKDLKLHQLTPTIKGTPTYKVKWDNISEIDSPQLHALRFASQRMRLNLNDFDAYQKIVNKTQKTTSDNPEILRLFTLCLAVGVDNIGQFKSEEEVADQFEQIRLLDPVFIRWFNEQLPLDQDLLPGTLRMPFAQILDFVKSIESVKDLFTQLKAPKGLEAINASARVLQYYQKLDNQEGFAEILGFSNQHLDGLDHRLFTTYPWLFKNYHMSWKDPRPAEGIPDFVREQFDIFDSQLKSIDFAQSEYFPNYDELSKAYQDIVCAGGVKEAGEKRRAIITDFIHKGCQIKIQDTPFRVLNKNEKDDALIYLERHLRANYKEQNLALCTKLFENYLAIEAEGVEPKQQMENLMKKFHLIDNKPHFDELGQVLGLLISKAKTEKRYYSVPQLTSWLEALLSGQYDAKHHYPINLLEEMLDYSLSNPLKSTLLNKNLNQLRATDSIEQLKKINSIAQSDLPNQYKPILVRLAIKNDDSSVDDAKRILQDLYNTKASSSWMKTAIGLIEYTASQKLSLNHDVVKELTKQAVPGPQNDTLVNLWQRTQIKLTTAFVNNKINKELLQSYFSSKTVNYAYIKMILSQTMKDWDEKEKDLLPSIYKKLESFTPEELQKLAEYYASDPIPSAKVLNDLLKENISKADQFIYQFETVKQGLDENNKPKRHYSVTEDDKKSLKRVLAGFKRKGKDFLSDQDQKALINLLSYTNNYSQVKQLHKLPHKQLAELLKSDLFDLKNPLISDKKAKNQAAARLLACMREVLLRKTGKWANHTQMLDLLYAALYNDESLLHQVRTGQGKSIITVMRAAFLALNGYVVDVFSSKQSLSQRDHEEFAPVLDGMGISHAYITESSPVDKYKTRSALPQVGAINYATIGNFSLFVSRHAWEGRTDINLNADNRVAWLDECDHILKDEHTQFNFSDKTDSDAIYNMDEWVYRVAYDFYLKNVNNFKRNEAGLLTVTRQDLKNLCESLQEQVIHSPKQSTFFQKYIIPALPDNKRSQEANQQAIKDRDQQLLQLLAATHIAYNLKPDKDYCTRKEVKIVYNGEEIEIQAAKVLINNQIQEAASFSGGVHQAEHVHLNKEAAKKGETPNYFVEPFSQIALSLNTRQILPKVYKKIEGCTGTAGDAQILKFYEETYGIKHVVKLPTHEEVGTEFLPTSFASNETAQVEEIVNEIILKSKMPILITCEDDRAVKNISKKLKERLEKFPNSNFSNFIVDTNDSGRAESEVVPNAGKKGAVTISSRMGRGTDIKPETEEGLMVIRTYPAPPNVVKQEKGRQGRNGAKGICKEIINYNEVVNQYNKYTKTPSYHTRIKNIYQEQKNHLDRKFLKHNHKNSQKWKWLEKNEPQQEKYLITRSVVQLNQELKQEQEKYLRRKESLIACLSHEVIIHLLSSKDIEPDLRAKWLKCRSEIDAAWNARLNGKQMDTEEIFLAFFNQANEAWKAFCDQCPSIGSKKSSLEAGGANRAVKPVVDTTLQASNADISPQSMLGHQKMDMSEVINFYQNWLTGAQQNYFDVNANIAPLIHTIYGSDLSAMNQMYQELLELSAGKPPMEVASDKLTSWRQKLFEQLTSIIKKQGVYHIPCSAIVYTINLINKNPERGSDYLDALETFVSQKWLTRKKPDQEIPGDITKNGKLLKLMMDIVNKKYVQDASIKFIEKFTAVIRDKFWNSFEPTSLSEVFALDPNVSELFTTTLDKTEDLIYFIDLLINNDKLPQGHRDKEKLVDYLKKNAEELKHKPSLLRSVFTLALANNYDRVKHGPNHLPAQDLLPNLSNESYSSFYYFLTQRPPIKEEVCNALINSLSQYQESKEFIKKVANPLNKLPPYLPLSYIVQHAKFGSQLDSCNTSLEEIRAAGEEFNKFLENRGIIESSKVYTRAKQEDKFQDYLNLFTAMPPSRGKQLFELANKISQVPSDIVSLTGKYLKDYPSFTTNEVDNIFRLSKKVNSLSDASIKNFWSGCLEEILNTHFQKVDNKTSLVEQVNSLYDFVDAIAESSFTIGPAELTKLHKKWNNTKNKELIKQSLEVLQKIKIFYHKIGNIINQFKPDNKYQDPLYKLEAATAEDNKDYLRFFELADKLKYFDIDEERAIYSLWQAFEANHNKIKLEEAFEVFKITSNLKKKENYKDYFLEYKSNTKDRQSIMQYLHHEILDFGPSFNKRCFDEYTSLAKVTTMHAVPRQYSNDPKARQQQLLNYQQIISLLIEIRKVATSPLGSVNSRVDPAPGNTLSSQHASFFNSQKKRYKSAWGWKSDVRKAQAKTLFSNLQKIDPNLSKVKSYEAAFKILSDTKKEIIESDQKSDRKQNTKGYSRLYDIVDQMYLTLVIEFLNDQDISLDQKNAINQQLETDLSFHINTFIDRLNSSKSQSSCEWVKILKRYQAAVAQNNGNFWKPGTTELEKFMKVLNNNRENIPDYLKYIVRTIDNLWSITVTDLEPVATLKQGMP